MMRAFQVLLVIATVLGAIPATAQTPTPSSANPTVEQWYAGLNGGVGVVEKTSGVFGLEAGVRVWKHVDAVGELVWAGNVVTGRQLEKVSKLAQELARVQGTTGEGTMTVPAFYGGLGARWVLKEKGSYRPYLFATVGGARVDLKPTIKLDGDDVTDSVAEIGATLGQDVIGKYNRFAISGGGGIIVPYREWYFDLGVRVLSVDGPEQQTNMYRLVLGGGRRF